MRKYILGIMLFLGAILGMASAAQASERHRMTQPPQNAAEYSQRFAHALSVNHDGNSAVDGPNCGLTCATPAQVLGMLQRADPDAHLTSVDQLPAYIAHLVEHAAPAGEYMMACKGGDGGVRAPAIWDCMSRHFHAGETCLMNPDTNRCVFARDCGNIVGIEIHIVNDCIELHVGMRAGAELHVGALGSGPFPTGRCQLMIVKAGESEAGTPALDECPRSDCNFAEASAFLHMPVMDRPRISWRAQVSGDYVIRLPREFLQPNAPHDLRQQIVLDLCLIEPDGRQSLGRVISRDSFYDGRTYVLYHGWSLSSPWRGTPYEWHFAGEASPHMTPLPGEGRSN